MHLIFNGLFLGAGLRWGDWRNWKKYHSTILFLWFGDLLYNYKESILAENLLPNHTIISLIIMFVAYPATMLIHLGKFPTGTF